MALSLCCRNLLLLLSVSLLVGCQPPAPTAIENQDEIKSKIVIDADNVTMSADYILDIKPSRYQPSIGLRGSIEPIKQLLFSAGQPLTVKEVFVEEGQWVEEGTPLLIVQRQTTNDETSSNAVSSTNSSLNTKTSDNEAAEDASSEKQDDPVSTETSNAKQGKNLEKPVNDNPTLATTTSSDPKPNTENSNSLVSEDITIIAPNKPSLNSTSNNGANTLETERANQNDSDAKKQSGLITIRAPFTGRVDRLNVKAMQRVDARQPLLHLRDDTDLRFIATLPIKAKSQLSIGQNVNFTTEGLTDTFTGQVSKLVTGSELNQLLVHVHVINNEVSRDKLKPNMVVTGRVNYGQIEVGTIVPKRAIHDADLSALENISHRPLMALAANVWIIQQDQRLARQSVEVIEYDPSTKQYLIAGVNNDSLICLANLPSESAGKKVAIR